MNKLMGFYELKDSSLPTIPWEIYTPDVVLEEQFLWTIRSAVYRGNDLNLPRAVGKNAKEAKVFADNLYNKIAQNGIVIYYPYFVAHKSGTLNVFYDKIILEAVKGDLWNLVTNHDIDVSLSYNIKLELQSYAGDKFFLNDKEIDIILNNVKKITNMFKDDIMEGRSILLEWSYASDCNIDGNSTGKPYLVFYEARTV